MKCEKCGAEVIMVEMPSGAIVPVDKTSINKKVVLSKDKHGKYFGRFQEVGHSHFFTCQMRNRKSRW
jgi:hypothetical protein